MSLPTVLKVGGGKFEGQLKIVNIRDNRGDFLRGTLCGGDLEKSHEKMMSNRKEVIGRGIQRLGLTACQSQLIMHLFSVCDVDEFLFHFQLFLLPSEMVVVCKNSFLALLLFVFLV